MLWSVIPLTKWQLQHRHGHFTGPFKSATSNKDIFPQYIAIFKKRWCSGHWSNISNSLSVSCLFLFLSFFSPSFYFWDILHEKIPAHSGNILRRVFHAWEAEVNVVQTDVFQYMAFISKRKCKHWWRACAEMFLLGLYVLHLFCLWIKHTLKDIIWEHWYLLFFLYCTRQDLFFFYLRLTCACTCHSFIILHNNQTSWGNLS